MKAEERRERGRVVRCIWREREERKEQRAQRRGKSVGGVETSSGSV